MIRQCLTCSVACVCSACLLFKPSDKDSRLLFAKSPVCWFFYHHSWVFWCYNCFFVTFWILSC